MRYVDERAVAWLNGEEAIARLISLAKHSNEAVSAAATHELLEMLCRRSMRVLIRPMNTQNAG